MNEELKPYFQNELAFLRKAGEQFARENPKIAERLILSPENCGDPHVERMIEAFCFVTAQVRRKLDDEFPEVTDALLSVLHPNLLAPIPSFGIVRVALSRAQATMKDGFTIPRGAALETDPLPLPNDFTCRYRTCYPLTVWPIDVTEASLRPAMSESDARHKAASILKVRLTTYSPELPFSQMSLDSFRFYLKGSERESQLLYELLFTQTRAITCRRSGEVEDVAVLVPSQIRPVGFAASESLLPSAPRSFSGYRLLQEYFAFSRKFLFVDVVGLAPTLAKCGSGIELEFHLDQTSPLLEKVVSAETFCTGCTPIVNLFKKKCEPMHLSEARSEYAVVPDSRSPIAHEIYTVDRVTATAPDGRSVEYAPLYSVSHDMNAGAESLYWQTCQREWSPNETGAMPGGETIIRFCDLARNAREAPAWIADIEATCLNRSLPDQLPAGIGRPAFRLSDGGPVSVTSLIQPTPTIRPRVAKDAGWRLISQLSLSYGSLLDPDGSPGPLREVLSLYDSIGSVETRARIAGILAARATTKTARVPGAAGAGWVRGVGLELEIDEEQVPNNGGYLLAAVLERFLSMYVSMNSFVELSVTSRKRKGVAWRWPARSADKTLL